VKNSIFPGSGEQSAINHAELAGREPVGHVALGAQLAGFMANSRARRRILIFQSVMLPSRNFSISHGTQQNKDLESK
jgi:hypothetical protein